MHEALTDRDAGTTLYLIGLGLDPENEEPDFFLLLACGERDRPVLVDDAIALFESPSQAEQVIERAGPEIRQLGPPAQGIELVCDIGGALYLVQGEDVDPSATIVNCLNTLFDLVAATRAPFPPEYRRVLYALADHATFHREFGAFIDQPTITRAAVIDAILWCVGVVMARARILRRDGVGLGPDRSTA